LEDGPPEFPQDSSCPVVLGCPTQRTEPFRLQDYHLLWLFFPEHSAKAGLCNSATRSSSDHVGSRDPAPTTHSSLHGHGLGCSPFARRYSGNRVCFLFLRVLRWFTSPGSLLHPMDSDEESQGLPGWVSPFGDLRVKACLTAHRSFSQLATSFVAFLHQGIPRMLLAT
jgi:hypothetical protein